MAENGIVNNLGVSRRSVVGITGMTMLVTLSNSDGPVPLVLAAMGGIIVIPVVYMILHEIKECRNGRKVSERVNGNSS